jgi:hypothetical protein
MANTLNIPERTLNQLGDSTNSINVIGGADGRKSVYEPLVVRVTNHVDNDAAEVGSDTDKMAIFMSSRHGEPWLKQANVLQTVIHKAAATPAVPTNVSCLYPNFDYATFS